MDRDDEKRIAAMIAKTLAMMCVRNTGLETFTLASSPLPMPVTTLTSASLMPMDARLRGMPSPTSTTTKCAH